MFPPLVRVIDACLCHLCSPQNLHLTAVSENILMENIDIFRKNGFEFQVDEDGMESFFTCPTGNFTHVVL